MWGCAPKNLDFPGFLRVVFEKGGVSRWCFCGEVVVIGCANAVF
jgi:hypothetical protein